MELESMEESVDESSEIEASAEGPEPALADPIDELMADSPESAIQIGSGSCSYYDPPRCSPRNCTAMCVTCQYDACRIAGNTCSYCKAEMELCKDDCNYPPECPPSNPFCDFD